MEHHFNIVIAKNFGVDEAIMIHNLYFWISKNEANKKHFYDGKYWTHNSMEAFTKLFPYWSKRQVERILNSLIEKGLIIKGNYNKIAYDRTSWYSITQIVKCIYANGEMDITEWLNGNHQTVSPIPDSNTDSKPISKLNIDFDTDYTNKELEKKNNISFDEFWDLYDKKVSRDNSEKKWNRLSDKDRELIMQFIPKYKAHQPDKKFRKDPLTFFNNKTWNDEIVSIKQESQQQRRNPNLTMF